MPRVGNDVHRDSYGRPRLAGESPHYVRSLVQSWEDGGWSHNGTGDRLSVFCPSRTAESQYLSLSVRDVYYADGEGYRLSYEHVPICKHVDIYHWYQFAEVEFAQDDILLIHRLGEIMECTIDKCAQQGTSEFEEARQLFAATV